LFIRLYLDEDVHKRIATALRLRHFDVLSAHELDRRGFSDDAQLAFAAANSRALFTFNTVHYLQLHQIWLRQNQEHSGIIVSDQLPLAETVRRLLNLLSRKLFADMLDSVKRRSLLEIYSALPATRPYPGKEAIRAALGQVSE
jgi:hypothetical protein